MKKKWFALSVVFVFMMSSWAVAQNGQDDISAAIDGGQLYLFANQEENGSWMDSQETGASLATTAMAVSALLETGISKQDPAIFKAIDFIKGFVQEDGGIYDPNDSGHANYANGVSLIALSLYGEFGEDPAFDAIIQNAVDYTLSRQNLPVPEEVDQTPKEYYGAYYGGWTYRKTSSGEWSDGDLSNTQYAVMGLWYAYQYMGKTIAGEAWADALFTYLKRSHGWHDEANGDTWNDQAWADGKNELGVDGAFSYKPDSESFYPGGSMTGAGLWCLAMIGLDQHKMVDIALEWFNAEDNYTWDRNAGDYYANEPDTAYYYYVYTMAKALTAVVGSQNNLGNHDWVQDLKNKMLEKKMDVQGADPAQNYWDGGGSLDGGDVISTSWVLMSLAFADPGTEAKHKLLPDPVDPDGLTNPVEGMVTLSVNDPVTITNAIRGVVKDEDKLDTERFPVGQMSFTLNNVPVGQSVVLTIQVPAGAMDPNNAESFVDADGNVKPGKAWFKFLGGKWKGLASVPIEFDIPNNLIKVTLTDGGPEDNDGEANGKIVDPGAPGYGFDVDAQPPGDTGDDRTDIDSDEEYHDDDDNCFIQSVFR